MAKKGIAVAHGAHDKDRYPWPVPTRPLASFDNIDSLLFEDQEFCTILDYRYSHMNHTLDEYENLSQAIEEILALIRGSLD